MSGFIAVDTRKSEQPLLKSCLLDSVLTIMQELEPQI